MPPPKRLHPSYHEASYTQPQIGQEDIKELHQIKRFSFAGILITCIGSLLLFGFQALLGRPFLANLLAYSICIPMAYMAHANYTFRAAKSKKNLFLFFMVAGVAYVVNLAVLSWALKSIPASAAQILAIASYAASSYLLQSRIVFR